MKAYTKPPATVVVIFGAGGDLTWRKLVPALYNLNLEHWLPERMAILGTDRKEMDDAGFRKRLHDGVDRFSRRGKAEKDCWRDFAHRLTYVGAEFDDLAAYQALAKQLAALDAEWDAKANHLFYLAVPPVVVPAIVGGLDSAGLARQDDRNRIVLEKPFGHDLASARELDGLLRGLFHEHQIYRIDHYLGKETVQNILAFRFANSLFEPVWDRRYIDHVQITVSEDLGVEHRGGYYDHAGALRDMVQNHLSQVLCLIAMEAPISYDADELRNKKVDVLKAVRPIEPDHVGQCAVRGQYGPGWVRGDHVVAYRGEPDVPADSNTETFAAVKYFIDNWRWQDVPFYLRTGKRLPVRTSEVVIEFRPVPHLSFPQSAIPQPQPNRLVIHIQPDEGIVQHLQAKLPGEAMQLAPVQMRFFYKDSFKKEAPEAYETLLLDVMIGDPTQFMRSDQLEASWAIIDPILEAWGSTEPSDFPNYAAGSHGPEAAEVLIARDGRSWTFSDRATPLRLDSGRQRE